MRIRRGRAGDAREERGFALLVVLWTLALLSLVVTAVIASGRSSARRDAAEVALAQGQAQADAAIRTAVYHLLAEGAAHWTADGTPHRLSEPDLKAEIRLTAESGKLNPNRAPPALLAAVFGVLGLPEDRARDLSRLVALWRVPASAAQQGAKAALRLPPGSCRPPGRPFETLDDLAAVPGMTPALLEALAPHLSFTQTADPSPRDGDPLLAAAFARLNARHPAAQDAQAGWNAQSVIAKARVTPAPGMTVTRRAVILLQPGGAPPFTLRLLETGGG